MRVRERREEVKTPVMEALRKQLSEVQGHLQDRDRKYKDLKFENEARINKLQKENEQLRLVIHNLESPDSIVLNRAKQEEIQQQFREKDVEIDAKTRQCEALQLKVFQLERDHFIRGAGQQQQAPGSPATPSPQTPSPAPPAPSVTLSLAPALASPEVSEAQVVALFTTLRERIRVVSMTRFSNSTPSDQIPKTLRDELNQLSENWESYYAKGNANGTRGNNDNDNTAAGAGPDPRMAVYLMRAMIWRYLHSALFMKPGRVWGQTVRDALRALGQLLSPLGVSEKEYQAWRTATGALLHRASRGSADAAVLNVVAKQVFDATQHFSASASGDPAQQLGRDLREIVGVAAELAAVFARSRYETLMADLPNSSRTRGFQLDEGTMELKLRVGASDPALVEMMITPCLIRWSESGKHAAVVKAEVIC